MNFLAHFPVVDRKKTLKRRIFTEQFSVADPDPGSGMRDPVPF
jgi:hypothetical protein